MSKPRKRRSPRGPGTGFGKTQSSAGRTREDTAGGVEHQVFAGLESVVQHLRDNDRFAVLFALTPAGRIDDEAIVMHGAEPIGIVPVPFLSRIADALPALDSPGLRQSIATYHAEQIGIGGRA